MGDESIPLRWPAAWKDPSLLRLLQATAFRHLLVDSVKQFSKVTDQARRAGLTVVETGALPPDTMLVHGPWPGVRLAPGGGDRAVAGPTGEPWVDSNGFRVRIARAQRPGMQVWVDAKPHPSRVSPADYAVAFADAAADGAKLALSLDDRLAADLAKQRPQAMDVWKQIANSAAFFATVAAAPANTDALIGVVSALAGTSLAFTTEVLNNLARTKQQYRVIASGRMTAESLAGLKAVIYTDSLEPPAEVRRQLLDFVNAGGMVIAGPGWGKAPSNELAEGRQHPRFAVYTVGKGTIALATSGFGDSYRVPNDAVVLVSHREDLARYWNSGPITPTLASSPDQKRAQLRVAFYSLLPVEDCAVWVKGAYQTAQFRTPTQTQAQMVRLEAQAGGVEVHLPPVAQYLELEFGA
jgi:hypothetical protein